MPETTPTRRHAGVTERAIAAAAARRADTRTPASWGDQHWVERAHACVGALAEILLIPRHHVGLQPDYTRAYGGWPWPLLTAADRDAGTLRFHGPYGDPQRITALGPCPTCAGEVPLIWMRTLADLGDLLTGAALTEIAFDPDPEFRADPGHAPTCTHAHLD
jgi:hypothetical protein